MGVRRGAALVVASLVAMLAGSAHAQAPREAPEAASRPSGSATLQRILELAERNHPTIALARARVAQVRAQLDEAHFAPFSQFKITGGVGPAPAIHGSSSVSRYSQRSAATVAFRADGDAPWAAP